MIRVDGHLPAGIERGRYRGLATLLAFVDSYHYQRMTHHAYAPLLAGGHQVVVAIVLAAEDAGEQLYQRLTADLAALVEPGAVGGNL